MKAAGRADELLKIEVESQDESHRFYFYSLREEDSELCIEPPEQLTNQRNHQLLVFMVHYQSNTISDTVHHISYNKITL